MFKRWFFTFIFCVFLIGNVQGLNVDKIKKIAKNLQPKESQRDEPINYSWKEISLSDYTFSVDSSNKKNSTEKRDYTDEDLKKFMMSLNNNPQKVERFKKLKNAGKKYALILIFVPGNDFSDETTKLVTEFSDEYNWKTIGIIPYRYKEADKLPFDLWKDCGIREKLNVNDFPPMLIMANPKNGSYKILSKNYYSDGRYRSYKSIDDLILKELE